MRTLTILTLVTTLGILSCGFTATRQRASGGPGSVLTATELRTTVGGWPLQSCKLNVSCATECVTTPMDGSQHVIGDFWVCDYWEWDSCENSQTYYCEH